MYFDYGRYRASREWALKRQAVLRRSGGLCERCLARATQIHHTTYERIGEERLTDLMAVCAPCHAFVSARSDHDPAKSVEFLRIVNSLLRRLADADEFAMAVRLMSSSLAAFSRSPSNEELQHLRKVWRMANRENEDSQIYSEAFVLEILKDEWFKAYRLKN